MRRSSVLLGMVAAGAVAWFPAPARAQAASPIAGAWTLNRSLSEMPPEIGFNVNWLTTPGADGRSGSTGGTSGGGGGRGRRGSSGGGGGGGGGGLSPIPKGLESYDSSRRVQLLTAEARNPPVRLMIVDTPGAVTITNELGQSRVLHLNVLGEPINVEGTALVATAKRDGDRLVIDYVVDQAREVRYTFSHTESPSQLVVLVEFLQGGNADKARRVYEPSVATETSAAGTSPPGARPAGAPAAPGSPAHPGESFDERPGAELKGLNTLGILVEDLSAQATACGLNHDAIEAALSKRLTDGGFTVRRNSDEDTYVYVNVMTTTTTTGTCVSRYDAFLYTHATANLSYRDRPVLVQVSLIHRGGMGSSTAQGHAAAVTRGLEDYVGLFVSQIRDANK